MSHCLARDLLDHDELTYATPATTVCQAAKQMAAHKCGSVLVVDNGHLVGIFTTHDLLTRVVAEGRGLEQTRLSEVMTPNPATIAAEASLEEALQRADEIGCRYLPVTENGRVVGVLSRCHLLLSGDLETCH